MISIIEFINSKNKIVMALIVSVVQLLIFVGTKSYLLYISFGIMFLGIKNIYSIKNGICKLRDSFTKNDEKTSSSRGFKFDKDKQIKILKKAGNFSLDYTDTIIISTAVGHHASILYSNYNTILSSFSDICENIYEIILEKSNHMACKFKINSKLVIACTLTILAILIYGITSVLLFDFFNPFIKDWIGHKYIFHSKTVFIFIIDFCIAGILLAIIKNKKTFRSSQPKKPDPLFILIINVTSSLILCTYLGIIGVVLGSIFSKGILNLGYEVFEVYKNYKGAYYVRTN